jgi:hypothetical protein
MTSSKKFIFIQTKISNQQRNRGNRTLKSIANSHKDPVVIANIPGLYFFLPGLVEHKPSGQGQGILRLIRVFPYPESTSRSNFFIPGWHYKGSLLN